MAKKIHSKFYNKLTASSKGIKEERAGRLESLTTMAQETMVAKLKSKVIQLQGDLDDLLDMAPTHTTSLKFTENEFNAESFVTEIQSKKKALYLAKVDLQIAEETTKEYFSETEE